jgi:hypothetical protein
MRRVIALLAACTLMLVAGISPAAATSPHRFLLEQTPMDVDFCGFTTHVEFPVNRAYATETDLADGTVILDIRGAAVVRVTNVKSGKTIDVNSSGPGTFTFAPDGSFTGELFGRGVLFAPNLTDFDLPSNFVAVAGPVVGTQAPGEVAFLTLTGHPRVITDICAALS